MLTMILSVFVGCGDKDTTDETPNNNLNISNNDKSNSNDSNSSAIAEIIDNESNTTNNSSSSVIEAYKGTIGDSKLVGEWNCVSIDNKGDYAGGVVYSYDADFFIMYNGQCYGSLIESLYGLEDSGDWINPVAAIDAKNGEFAFTDVSVNGDATMDLKATYIISDIEKSSISERDDINMFYRNTKDDQLTIHFTGSLKVGPTDIRSIDFTVVYEKEGIAGYDNEGILWAAMVGEWKDNYGNQWTFMPRTETGDLGFTMVADGKEYQGKSGEYIAIDIGAYDVDGKTEFLMELNFEDENMDDIYHAKVISFNGNELCLEQKNGQALTFTK